MVRSFLCSTKVQFRAVVARDARRFLLGVTQLRSMVYAFSVASEWDLRLATVLKNEDVDAT